MGIQGQNLIQHVNSIAPNGMATTDRKDNEI